ncbi:phytoene dehydrogenase-like protein [Aneurinibacillus soli]|uniref:15-cis-phytoene desaturase n=1 Tax=Aneurinibacillus soli TaxID=1500254 RepID=A0A0U5C4W0_9BACL|nr:NAD(P)/FAD-dependent oxidoreductase [Aneurinibacillus soli]PYE60914.1 phytoene dehydrogenase-like protein [Aneurinibacillus soli]BAU26819.1 15-cis-phytoene desaturase [Aneurinibacillus soli]
METNETQHFDVVIVGGGLAGLSTAAYLAKNGKKVVVLERGNLGGRAVTLKLKGFSFNFGAHAIYGRDSSVLKKFEKDLGIQITWKDFEPSKAKYDIGDRLSAMPANIQGLFRTSILNSLGKVKFTFNIFKTMLHMEKGHPHMSIEKWMEEKQVSEDVKNMMLTLASSNFFTREPERIPSDVFFTYYQRLFTSNKPVAYIGGGWQALIAEFVRVIEENNGVVITKAKAESIEDDGDRVTKVHTTQGIFEADEFVFCMPPKELEKIVTGTKVEHFIKQYSSYEPSYVYVYDIGLSERIDVPYTYIYDKANKMFITDISHYDESCVPEGGQMLQAIAYLSESDLADKDKVQEYHDKIEALYDKHFVGWRDKLVVPRVSKRAAAQEIKWTMNQKPMPVYLPDYRNVFFAGDWCEGKGQLSELSFSSAFEASQLIIGKYSHV